MANLIRLNQRELLDMASMPFDCKGDSFKMAVISRLQSRLRKKKEKTTVEDRSFFGREIVYPDGVKHFIGNSWNS